MVISGRLILTNQLRVSSHALALNIIIRHEPNLKCLDRLTRDQPFCRVTAKVMVDHVRQHDPLASRASTIKELSVAHVLLDTTLAPRIPWILYLGDHPLMFLGLSHYDVPRLRGQIGKAWISWTSNSGTEQLPLPRCERENLMLTVGGGEGIKLQA